MELHNYQKRIVEYLRTREKSILSVDMGLGKTAAVLHYIEATQPRSVLIVAPKRVAETVWKQEAEKWGLTIADKFCIVSGTIKKRCAILEDPAKPYKIVSRDNLKDVICWQCDLLVLDELTSFKNCESNRMRIICTIEAAKKIGLTGTFLANGAIDIYGQAAAVGLGLPPFNFYGWRAMNFRDLLQGSGLHFSKWKPTKPLENILQPIRDNIFTLSADDYLEIPEITEIAHPIELGKESRSAYDDLQSFLQFEIGGEVMTMDEAQKFCKLQQLCDGFVYEAIDEENVRTIRGKVSDKLQAVCEFVERCKGEGEPVLLAYAYKEEARWLAEMFDTRGIKWMTPKQSCFLDKWNVGEIDVLMAHPASAGHGLNLQYGGRILVWSSLTYNYELFAQFNARLARQGQTKPVQIHYFTALDTIEEMQRKALQAKDNEQQKFVRLTK